MRLNNEEMRAILDRYWEATVTQNLEKVHEFYHDDVVIEFPQSGERIRGKQNIYELRSHYPTKTSYKVLRVRGDGDLWITEVIVTYDNDKGNTIYGVAIMEFRNDKVVHETLYFAYPFKPPEWRSKWVEIIKEPLK
jgi:ketosteroid isomerase-like protein